MTIDPVELSGPPPREWDKDAGDHPWVVLISKTYGEHDDKKLFRVAWTVGAAVAHESALQIGLDTSGTPAEVAARVAEAIRDHLDKFPALEGPR